MDGAGGGDEDAQTQDEGKRGDRKVAKKLVCAFESSETSEQV